MFMKVYVIIYWRPPKGSHYFMRISKVCIIDTNAITDKLPANDIDLLVRL